jgi:hypothetical protein
MSFADFADLIQGKAIVVQKAWEAERLGNMRMSFADLRIDFPRSEQKCMIFPLNGTRYIGT